MDGLAMMGRHKIAVRIPAPAGLIVQELLKVAMAFGLHFTKGHEQFLRGGRWKVLLPQPRNQAKLSLNLQPSLVDVPLNHLNWTLAFKH